MEWDWQSEDIRLMSGHNRIIEFLEMQRLRDEVELCNFVRSICC